MRIEKINDNKIKIMFNSEELKANNITVHSFLSGSNEAQRLFLAILEIANEEFGFDIKNCNISSETISFENKDFVIFVTKSINMQNQEFNKISPYNLLDFVNNYHTSKKTLSFLPPHNFINSSDKLLYKFSTLMEVLEFCKYFNNTISVENIPNLLYKYNEFFLIVLDIKRLSNYEKQVITYILSEYKSSIYLSPLAYYHFLEHSTLILNKVIQAL